MHDTKYLNLMSTREHIDRKKTLAKCFLFAYLKCCYSLQSWYNTRLLSFFMLNFCSLSFSLSTFFTRNYITQTIRVSIVFFFASTWNTRTHNTKVSNKNSNNNKDRLYPYTNKLKHVLRLKKCRNLYQVILIPYQHVKHICISNVMHVTVHSVL